MRPDRGANPSHESAYPVSNLEAERIDSESDYDDDAGFDIDWDDFAQVSDGLTDIDVTTVQFPPDISRLSGDGLKALDVAAAMIAKTALTEIRAGRPKPVLNLVVHGSDIDLTANQRAAAIAAIKDGITAHAHDLQRNVPFGFRTDALDNLVDLRVSATVTGRQGQVDVGMRVRPALHAAPVMPAAPNAAIVNNQFPEAIIEFVPTGSRWWTCAPRRYEISGKSKQKLDALADRLVDSALKRKDLGYLPPTVNLLGDILTSAKFDNVADHLNAAIEQNLTARNARLPRQNWPTIEEVFSTGQNVDITVDWVLRRPTDFTPAPAPVGTQSVDQVITATGVISDPILNDPSWRHASINPLGPNYKPALWFDPSDHPVDVAALEHHLGNAHVTTVNTERRQFTTGSVPGVDGTTYGSDTSFDHRVLTDVDGNKIQHFTVKQYAPQPAFMSDTEYEAFLNKTLAAADEYFNKGYRFPDGSQFHAKLEFVDNPIDAHHEPVTIHQDTLRENTQNVSANSLVFTFAHELVGHPLGLFDEYAELGENPPVFLKHPPLTTKANDFGRKTPVGRVVFDHGIMGYGDGTGTHLAPRNLVQLQQLVNSQAATPVTSYDQLINGTEAPIRRGRQPDTQARQDTMPATQHADKLDIIPSRGIANLVVDQTDVAVRLGELLGQQRLDLTELHATLQRTGTRPDAVALLDAKFQQLYQVPLGTVLDHAVADGRLTEAQRLDLMREIGSGGTSTQPKLNVAVQPWSGFEPQTLPQVQTFTLDLLAAINSGDVQSALAMLDTAQRDTRVLWAVQDAFQSLTNTSLWDKLIALAPHSSARIGTLLGNVSSAPISLERAQGLYKHLSTLTIDSYDGGLIPVPTQNPEEGCVLRAHVWALELARLGVAPRKFIVTHPTKGLTFQSSFAENARPGEPGTVSWSHHVAPAVQVGTSNGPQWMVIDPALGLGVAPIDTVLAAMGVSNGGYNIFEGTASGIEIPSGKALVLLTEPHVMSFPSLSAPKMPINMREADRISRNRLEPEFEELNQEIARRKTTNQIWVVLNNAAGMNENALRKSIRPILMADANPELILSSSGPLRDALAAALPTTFAKLLARTSYAEFSESDADDMSAADESSSDEESDIESDDLQEALSEEFLRTGIGEGSDTWKDYLAQARSALPDGDQTAVNSLATVLAVAEQELTLVSNLHDPAYSRYGGYYQQGMTMLPVVTGVLYLSDQLPPRLLANLTPGATTQLPANALAYSDPRPARQGHNVRMVINAFQPRSLTGLVDGNPALMQSNAQYVVQEVQSGADGQRVVHLTDVRNLRGTFPSPSGTATPAPLPTEPTDP